MNQPQAMVTLDKHSAPPQPLAEGATASPSVYILARKILKNNTRIFKQAQSLSAAGYNVTLIGILANDTSYQEAREGYNIIRLELKPLHYRLLNLARYGPVTIERATLRGLRRVGNWITLKPLKFSGLGASPFHAVKPTLAVGKKLLRVPLIFFYPITLGVRATSGLRATAREQLAKLSVLARNEIATYERPADEGSRSKPVHQRLPILTARILIKGTIFIWRKLIKGGIRLGRRNLNRVRRFLIRLSRRVYHRTRRLLLLPMRRAYNRTRRFFIRLGRRTRNWMRRSLLLPAHRRYNRAQSPAFRLVKKGNRLLYLGSRNVLMFFRWPLVSIDYYYRTYHCVARELPKPDIIHANDLDALLVATALAKRLNARLVYDAQELYTGIHTLPGWYRKWLTVQEFFLIHLADKKMVVNDAIGEVMERRYRVKIDSVILNCPPYEDFSANGDKTTIRKKFGISADTPIYLYSGGLGQLRGIENTILSLKYLDEGVLVILGEGHLKASLIQLINAQHLEHRVYFSDFVPHTEVPSYISSADVGIIPYENVGVNHYLCSPSKLFHYIMAELPVACSDFPFLRKVVLGNGIGQVFDPGDSRSIARAMAATVADSRNGGQMKINLKTAKRKYCWEEEEKKVLAVYEELSRSVVRKHR